jgi:hypothetical protein
MSKRPFVLPELTPEQIAELKQRWEAMYRGLPETEVRLIATIRTANVPSARLLESKRPK